MTEQDIAKLILGESVCIRRMRAEILGLGRCGLPILIQGPTGAGKELVAQALHLVSGRPGRLVAVNCAAIPDTMGEAEMFGYVRGAFTGAVTDHPGYLLEADHGTLFLDEIASMSPTLQPKLLRALDTKEFRPGGARTNRSSDFRVIAAANEDLERRMGEQRFRADLLARLRGAVIAVPGLDRRLDDIPLLVRHFARAGATAMGRAVDFSDAAMRLLQARAWPGHVRELRLAVERVVALSYGTLITANSLRSILDQRDTTRPPSTIELKREALIRALTKARNDTGRAARLLEVDRSTIYRRSRRFDVALPLDLPDEDRLPSDWEPDALAE